jgi:hypothetical protein
VGVSTNKMLAKLASRAAKPDGIHVAPYGSPAAAALIANTDLKNVPQMGGAVAKGLAALGVTRLGQVREMGWGRSPQCPCFSWCYSTQLTNSCQQGSDLVNLQLEKYNANQSPIWLCH